MRMVLCIQNFLSLTGKGDDMMRTYQNFDIEAPTHDFDVTIRFPNGKTVQVQARPSNADVNYNGSLDFILPDNACVTCWIDDDMRDAPPFNGEDRPHERLAKQLVTELPWGPPELEQNS